MPYGTVNADVIGTSVAGANLGAGNASIMKNRIINGAMVIDQRNAGASIGTASSTSTYTLDRWLAVFTQNSKFTLQQNAGSVTPPVGFANYIGITTTSAYSGSGDIFSFGQLIEGFNTADLGWGTANAKTITISFWVRSSLTGTFGGALQNSALNRSYPFTFTISAANTWEQKSVTVAGDTSGTWIGATNGIGLRLWIDLGSGSTWAGTAGSWASADYRTATGGTSIIATAGATLYITGVQLEVGSSATGFEYVNYQTSLANCQRYYELIGGTGDSSTRYPHMATYQAGTYDFGIGMPFVVQKRAIPTMTVVGTFAYSNASGASADGASKDGFRFSATATATGYARVNSGGTTAYITASAEL